jgi:hypothetical protein
VGADDNITVGLSETAHGMLRRLKDDGVFEEMKDAYRCGIAVAIARGLIAPEGSKFGTVFNIGSLDPDGAIRMMVVELFPEARDAPYSYAERLAEAGVTEMGSLHEADQLRFGALFKSFEAISE